MGPIGPMRRRLSVVETANTAIRAKKEESLQPRVAASPGRRALDLFDLEDPLLDWIRLAGSMGVEAARAETLEEFADLLVASYRLKGPFLIELVIP
jgi:thiamine pyrophosphate-dependent acetolactate synthase large subunit-like protein